MKRHPSRSGRRAAIALLAALPWAARAGETVTIDVWKNASCGCCNDWIKYLRAEGFTVRATDVPDTAPWRARAGLPEKYGSCHTALVGGYALEGHVPAREIRRLLRERPVAIGLAVPGMPVGSPGMEQGSRVDPYDVLLVSADGSASVYVSYGRGAPR
jgi:hypothetical protein